jgi:hypothetical protein
MAFETIRVLIWGKTYPEISKKYVETVCTGRVREDGSPIRRYPVPLRYLDGSKQYSLYDWIEVPVEKSHSDRPCLLGWSYQKASSSRSRTSRTRYSAILRTRSSGRDLL